MFEFFKRKKNKENIKSYFTMLNGYTPVFENYNGGLYEMELTRSCIHSFANHVSKLKPTINGYNNSFLESVLQFQPNELQDTSKWLYQLATIYQVENKAFIIPEYDRDGSTIIGFHNAVPSTSMIVKGDNEQLFLKYDYYNQKKVIELDRVAIISKFMYKNGIIGENNAPISTTLEVLNTTNQGIIESIKKSAIVRFFVKIGRTLNDKDLATAREDLSKSQLSLENSGGIFMLDNRFSDFQQIDNKPYIIDDKQMECIKNNVFSYLNTNENIIQNKYTSEEWNAYYEGAIEPFALQLSLTLSNMLFNSKEKAQGYSVVFTANRLQYLSNVEKLNTVVQLFDRGFITHNQGLEIFNMGNIENGNKRFIRKEYAETNYIINDNVEHDEIKEKGEKNG